jgi:hypothetical protein
MTSWCPSIARLKERRSDVGGVLSKPVEGSHDTRACIECAEYPLSPHAWRLRAQYPVIHLNVKELRRCSFLPGLLCIAHERGYIAKNPHGWIHLQQERRPPIDPLSFEEKERFLAHLPEPAYGFRKSCPDFW